MNKSMKGLNRYKGGGGGGGGEGVLPTVDLIGTLHLKRGSLKANESTF